MSILHRQLDQIQQLIAESEGGPPPERIRVVRQGDDEFVTAGFLGIGGGNSGHDQALVSCPLFVDLEGNVWTGQTAAIFGSFSDRTFTYEEFVAYAEGDHLWSMTGEEARRVVTWLREQNG